MANNNEFLGKGWSFPPEFGGNGKIDMVSNDRDIQESLTILLNTSPGERVMSPEYGCDIKSFAFSEIDITTMTLIKAMVSKAILFFEPRITLENIDITGSDSWNGKLRLNIVYTIITTNTRSNMIYPFYINEGTLLDSK